MDTGTGWMDAWLAEGGFVRCRCAHVIVEPTAHVDPISLTRGRIQHGIVEERETVQVRIRFVDFVTLSVLTVTSSHFVPHVSGKMRLSSCIIWIVPVASIDKRPDEEEEEEEEEEASHRCLDPCLKTPQAPPPKAKHHVPRSFLLGKSLNFCPSKYKILRPPSTSLLYHRRDSSTRSESSSIPYEHSSVP